MFDLIEVLKITTSAVAALATLAAAIYTWVWWKTTPATWTLTGLTSLLWSFMLMSWVSRILLSMREDSIEDAGHGGVAFQIMFSALIAVGYILFLIGTYRTGPICNRNNNKKAV